MVAAAVSFLLLELLPVDFSYVAFAALLLLNGLAMGLFSSPNRAAIMNSLPADQRGAGAGMRATFQNAAAVSAPFAQALNVAFTFALAACLIAAAASLLRGGRYHHEDHAALEGEAAEPVPSGLAPVLQRSA